MDTALFRQKLDNLCTEAEDKLPVLTVVNVLLKKTQEELAKVPFNAEDE